MVIGFVSLKVHQIQLDMVKEENSMLAIEVVLARMEVAEVHITIPHQDGDLVRKVAMAAQVVILD